MAFVLGNTAQRLYVRCEVRFFVRLYKIDAGILAYVKEILCKIKENLQAYPKGICVSIQIADLVKHWQMTCKASKRSLCGVALTVIICL